MSREKKKEARFQSCKTSAQSNQKANWKKVGYQLFSFVLATFKSARRSIHEKQGVTWAKKKSPSDTVYRVLVVAVFPFT